MAETAQIAEIARIVSDLVFAPFGWQRAGTSDHNFKGPVPQFKTTNPAQHEDLEDEQDAAAEKPVKNTEASAPVAPGTLKGTPINHRPDLDSSYGLWTGKKGRDGSLT